MCTHSDTKGVCSERTEFRYLEKANGALRSKRIIYHSRSAHPVTYEDQNKTVTDFQLLVDLHRPAELQGSGGDAETIRALELAWLDRSRPLKIADIGCGTGASTLLLARELDTDITAVDFLPEFLDEL